MTLTAIIIYTATLFLMAGVMAGVVIGGARIVKGRRP